MAVPGWVHTPVEGNPGRGPVGAVGAMLGFVLGSGLGSVLGSGLGSVLGSGLGSVPVALIVKELLRSSSPEEDPTMTPRSPEWVTHLSASASQVLRGLVKYTGVSICCHHQPAPRSGEQHLTDRGIGRPSSREVSCFPGHIHGHVVHPPTSVA